MLCLISYHTYRCHSATSINGTYDVTAIDIYLSITAYYTSQRIVQLLISLGIGVSSATSAIDVATISIEFCRVTNGTAMNINKGVIIGMPVLATAIY